MSPSHPNQGPYAEEWLAFEEATGGRFCCSGSALDVREQFNGLQGQLASQIPPPTDEVVTADYTTNDNVPVRVYKPANASLGLALGLYIHSGGWVAGSVDGEDHLLRQLALSVPCVLATPEYRLAPENPFPAALDDCVSAYKFMVAAAESLGGDATKLFIVGGSAGGNLSLTTALSIVAPERPEDGAVVPRGVFALCPAVVASKAVSRLPDDLKAFFHGPEAYADAAMIGKQVVESCGGKRDSLNGSEVHLLTHDLDAFTGSSDPAHPLISPGFHPKLSALPYVYSTTSNKDPLNDDAMMLRHKLKQEGVEVELREYDGYPHFFHILSHLQGSQRFMADLVDAIRRQTH